MMRRPPTSEKLRTELRARGLRATMSRVAVLEVLHAADQPISHAEVVERLAGLGVDPATLYRNLIDLVDAKLARRADVGDHVWRFALQRDGHDVTTHPHFVCTGCGTMQCLPALEVIGLPRAVKQRAFEVHVRGLCDACQ